MDSGAKASSPSKSQINPKKSPMNIIVIFYCPKSLKISHDYGLVSVRIFYKNNLIFFVLSTRILLKGKLRFIKLLWKKIRHLVIQICRISRYTEFPGQFILEFLEILVTDVMGLPCNISSSTAKFLIITLTLRLYISLEDSGEPHD